MAAKSKLWARQTLPTQRKVGSIGCRVTSLTRAFHLTPANALILDYPPYD